MTDDKILKQVLKNLGNIAAETGKETMKQVGKITEAVITGKELLGIEPMSDEELARKRAEDEQKRQREMSELRAQMGQGRNVEAEIKQVEDEKDREEQQQLRQEQADRRAQIQTEAAPVPMESSNRARRKKSRGSAFVAGKKKTQQPDPTQMSQTAEFSGKME